MEEEGDGAPAKPLLSALQQKKNLVRQEVLQLRNSLHSCPARPRLDQNQRHQVSILPLPALESANNH